MKYDFTSIMERHGQDSIAIDDAPGSEYVKEGFDQIPMWVADMNFPTVPTIQEEIIKRAKHPAFGYFRTSDEYYDSIKDWQKTRNGVTDLHNEDIGYENGVLGGVSSALAVLCSKGDHILLHSPTYIGFNEVNDENGYHMVHSPLHLDDKGVWRMDFEDMDAKIKKYHIHAAIFCSPHNPTGRVWEKWEIEKAMEVFERNQVYVISDEIWSDLILDGYKHVPTQSVSEYARTHTIALYAPSKTFNLSGLIGGYHIIYDPWLRDRIRKEEETTRYNDMNVLSMHALIGAYKPEGHEWTDELCHVLTENTTYGWQYIHDHFKGVQCAKPQGTYMLLLDCRGWCEEHHMTIDELFKKGCEVGVMWQNAKDFNVEYGIRMNTAVPLSRVREAFDRLDHYVFNAE